MKRLIAIIFFSLLSLGIMCFIFWNSIQSPESSMEKSSVVVHAIAPEITDFETEEGKAVSALVRKTAHFMEFAALGFSLGCLSLSIWGKGLRRWLSPLIGGFLIAVADETLQRFNGRTSSVKDILLDFAGAAFAIGLLALISHLLSKTRGKRDEQA